MLRRKYLSLIIIGVMVLSSFLVSFKADTSQSDEDAGQTDERGASIDYMYIVQFTHLDIGYTAPIDEVAEECKDRIDQVLGYMETYPRFNWTIESIWQLKQWLNRTTNQTKIDHLFDLVRDGRMSIGAGHGNMHSSKMGHEEMNRFIYTAKSIEDTYNVSINTAFMDDVPGWSWALPQTFNRSGLSNFIVGPNDYLGGMANISMKDRPFNWLGPDGSNILTWMGYANGYIEGTCDYQLHLYPSWKMEENVTRILQEWIDAGYPYDAILISDATGDNGMANRAIEIFDNVDYWNNNHDSQMILSTPEEFFKHMREKYPGQFANYSGDSAGFWDAGNCFTPNIEAKIRWSHDHVAAAEKLASINFMLNESYPESEIETIYSKILTCDDHSGNGDVSWPESMTKSQVDHNNEICNERADSAYQNTSIVLSSGLQDLASKINTNTSTIMVFNPLSWDREDIVRIKLNSTQYEQNFKIKDAVTADFVPYARIGNDTIEFIADDVPQIGYRLYKIIDVETVPEYPNMVNVSSDNRIIENSFYKVEISSAGRIVSILDKQTQRELINSSSDLKFNGVIRANNSENFWETYHHIPLGTPSFNGTSGPVSGKIAIDYACSPLNRTEIVLYSSIKRIDIKNIADETQMDFVPYDDHSDHYSFTFPYNLSVGDNFTAHIENPNIFINPSTDYLPGANIGMFVSQHCIDVRENYSFGVTHATKQTCRNEIGGVGHFNDVFEPPEATIISKFFQKQDQGLVLLKVQWDAPNITGWTKTPDISGLIQEFIDRPNYTEGYHICINPEWGDAGEYEFFKIGTWEKGVNHEYAAKLHVKWNGSFHTFEIVQGEDDSGIASFAVHNSRWDAEDTEVGIFYQSYTPWLAQSAWRWSIDVPKGSTIEEAYVDTFVSHVDIGDGFAADIQLLNYTDCEEFNGTDTDSERWDKYENHVKSVTVNITSVDNYTDISKHEYSITSSEGAFSPINASKFGWSFDSPLLTKVVDVQRGPLEFPSLSFFSVDKPNVMLVNVKKACYGNSTDLILRVLETDGKNASVNISSCFRFSYAELNNNIEECIPNSSLPVEPIRFDIHPYQVLTIRAAPGCHIHLDGGWNLMSVPLIQMDENIATVLRSIDGKYDYVRHYDAVKSVDPWMGYETAKPWKGDLTFINHTMAIWLHMTENATLNVNGVKPKETDIPLYKGWNFVGYPSFIDKNVSEALNGIPYEQVEGFDEGTPPYYLRILDDEDMMTAGNGYWIRVTSDCIWTIYN